MRPLPYRVFLWVFSASNALVWFGILYGLGFFIHGQFAESGRLSRSAAVAFFCLTPLVSTLLSLQGFIVNLRAQFLGGRFSAPTDAGCPSGGLRNVWLVALMTAAAFCVVSLPLLGGALTVLLPDSLRASQVGVMMGSIGALTVLVVGRRVGDREFRRYARDIEASHPPQASVVTYVVRYIAVPWGLINLLINAALAWILYRHATAGVAVTDVRGDLTVMSFLLCVFMALSALPEAEADFHRNFVDLPVAVPPMPRLWTRYAYALGLAVAMHMAVTGVATALGVSHISLGAMIVAKGVVAGVVAGAAAGVCALWALSRCSQRRAAAVAVKMAALAAL